MASGAASQVRDKATDTFPRTMPSQGARELSVGNVIAICRRHLLLLLGWVALVMAATILITYSLQPRFRSDSMLMIDTRVQQVSSLKSVVSSPLNTPDSAPVMRSEVQILTSPELAAKVIDRLDLANTPSFQDQPGAMAGVTASLRSLCIQVVGEACQPKPLPAADAMRTRNQLVSKYLSRLSVFNDGRSFTLSVGFQDADPKVAAAVVNTHVELYLAEQRAFKRRASLNGVAWIEQQLARLGATLSAKQQELLSLRESSGLIYAKGTTIVAQQVADINAQLIQARADLVQRQARLSGTGARGGGTSAQSDVLGSPLIQALRGQEAQARQTLEDVSQRYGADFPVVLQARARVDEVQRRLAAETGRIVSSNDGDATVAARRVSELERALAGLQAQLVTQDQASARLIEMERDVAGTRVVYQGLLERQQELEVQAGTEEPDARLVSAASEPLAPFFPNKTMLLSLGLLSGIVTGMGLVFVVDKPERGIQIPSELGRLMELHTLSPLPLVRLRRRRTLPDDLLDNPKSEFAEAIRSLRGDIAVLPGDRPAKVLALTSALPQEGKTSVAAALARSMAISGLHVLLVDCDMRRHRIGSTVNVRPGTKGLVAVLQNSCLLAEAVLPDSRTSLELLLVEQQVTMPQDLLGSPAFAAMLDEARRSYDFIVLDTPPQGAVSDPLIIGSRADMILVVVRWNSTPPAIVRWTLDAFEKHGLTPAGVFLNQVDYPSLIRKDADARTAYRSTRSYYLHS